MTARKNSARSGNATLAGVGLMLLGVFLFSCNDAQGKWLLATYPVGQMLLIRSIADFGSVPLPTQVNWTIACGLGDLRMENYAIPTSRSARSGATWAICSPERSSGRSLRTSTGFPSDSAAFAESFS